MRQSAVNAGFLDIDHKLSKSKLHFVTEPEAAAFGIWSASEMENPKAGETFLGTYYGFRCQRLTTKFATLGEVLSI